MGLKQFATSLRLIVTNPHVNRRRALRRHLQWQVRKGFGRFPFEQAFSSSRIIASDPTCGVSALIYSQGIYDYNNMNLVRLLLSEGGTFFDIGANIGAYSLLASEEPAARVIAFEPHPRTFGQLETNVALNGRTNVVLVNAALGHHDGAMRISDGPQSATNHLVNGDENGISISSVRGDHYCETHGVEPQLMKLDVEGFEYEVLEGFGQHLRKAGLVLIEINGLSDRRSRGRTAIEAMLRGAGLHGPYQCDFDGKRLDAGTHAREDAIYLSPRLTGPLERLGFVVTPPVSAVAKDES